MRGAASSNGRSSRGGSIEAAGKGSHLLESAGPQSVVVASMDQDTRDRHGLKDMV
jgi:hypothetical protein